MVEKFTGKRKKSEHEAGYHGHEPPIEPCRLGYSGDEPPIEIDIKKKKK